MTFLRSSWRAEIKSAGRLDEERLIGVCKQPYPPSMLRKMRWARKQLSSVFRRE